MYEDLTQSQSWVNNLNNTFGTKVKSLEFYNQAKNMALFPKQIEPKKDSMIENEDSVSVFEENEATQNEMKYGKQLMRKYYVSTLKHLEVPKPQFANILKNVLYVSEQRITDGMAESLKVFVQHVDKDKNPSNVVRKLCFSDNGLTDEAFAKILEGFVIQNK